jgi:hypothetical protein
MTDRRQRDPDGQVLSESIRERLLRRASELDAARSGTRMADLRAAAAEAGISPAAFDEAVAELHLADEASAPAPLQGSRARSRFLRISVAVMVGLVAIGVLRMVIPMETQAVSTGAIVEQSFVLRCLSTPDAADLIRTNLRGSTGASVITRGNASRIITVRATNAEIERVKQMLEENDGVGSTACTVPRTSTP